MTIIRVADIETTGTNPDIDRIIEVGWCDLDTERMQIGAPVSFLVCPEMKIPPEASAVHHLTNADVDYADPWGLVKENVPLSWDLYAAHNAAFEKGWLKDDTVGDNATWICTYKCALRIWPDAPSHSNQALRYYLNHFGLCRATAEKAHRGILWRDVPSSYLEWVADKSTLDDNTKFTARYWLTERAS